MKGLSLAAAIVRAMSYATVLEFEDRIHVNPVPTMTTSMLRNGSHGS
jgi:hypothetical protein